MREEGGLANCPALPRQDGVVGLGRLRRHVGARLRLLLVVRLVLGLLLALAPVLLAVLHAPLPRPGL
eukprot:2539210-Alexandrium_andersonii.AAC.1